MKHILTVLIFFTSLANAQDTIPKKQKPQNDNTFSWDKVSIGGNLGLQFGSYTFIDISPLIGYRVTEKLMSGFGVTYKYLSIKNSAFNGFSTHIYGGSIFSRYYFLDNLFGHGEYEVLNLDAFDIDRRVNITNILGGGGYRQFIGGATYAEIMVLWNFNESAYSLYSNPIIRGGINIGF